MNFKKHSFTRLRAAQLTLLIPLFLTPGCLKFGVTSEAMTESELVQMHSTCGEKRTFLFTHAQFTLKGQSKKDWSCWYATTSDRVFGKPTSDELQQMFARSKPIVWKYINSNTLTKRLADIDTQRTAILWLGTGLAILGCGALAAGSGGLALAACTLLGSATASYDVFGGDPSQGAAEAWKQMAQMTDKEIVKMECNAVRTIMEQARLIDKRVLKNAEGASSTPCPSATSLLTDNINIVGVQAGPEEVKSKSRQTQK